MPRDMFGIGNINILGSSKTNKRDKQPAHLKEATRQRWWGNNIVGECFSCGRTLHFQDSDLGHIRASIKGGKWAPENTRLICRNCNSGMGTTNMKTYMKEYHPTQYAKMFPEEEKVEKSEGKTKEKVDKPKNKKPRKKSSGPTYIDPMTGRIKKANFFG